MTPEQRFAALAVAVTEAQSTATLEAQSKGFGSGTLKVGGRIFALYPRAASWS